MSIALVRTAASGSSTNGSNVQAALSASVVSGHLLLEVIGAAKGTQTSPWVDHVSGSPFGTLVSDESAGANSSDMRGLIYARISQAGDAGTTFQWDHSLTCASANQCYEFSGVDTTTPVDVVGTPDHDVSSLPGITTLTDGALIVLVVVMDATTRTITGVPTATGLTFTQVANFASASGTNDPNVYVFTAPQTTKGATGTITWTPSSNANCTAQLFALRPAGGVASLDLTGVPGSAGATGVVGIVAGTSASILSLTGVSGGAETGGLAAQVLFDYQEGPGSAGAGGVPLVLTTVSATLSFTGALGGAGAGAHPATLHLDTVGRITFRRTGGAASAAGIVGQLSLDRQLVRTGGAGSGSRPLKMTTALPVDIAISIGLTDRDQWTFGRADA